MATNIELVQQLYVAYFNRPADVAGLNFWVGALDKGISTDVIAAEFAKQAEYKSLFSGKSVDAIIDTVYMNMFGRHAEQAALDFYGPLVQNGTITIDKVVTDIVAGAQGTDGDAYNNKVSASVSFTEALAAPGNEADRVAYSSGDTKVLNIAKDFLAGVTTDATLTTQLAKLETTVDSLAGAVVTGQSFVLTNGTDTFTGAEGNDTFTAAPTVVIDPATGTQSIVDSVQTVDKLTGGAGTDTLNVTIANAATNAKPIMSSIESVNVTFSAAGALDLAAASGVTSVSVDSSTAAGTVKSVGDAALSVSNTTTGANFDGSTASTLVLSAKNVGKTGALATIDTATANANVATAETVVVENSYIDLNDTVANATLVSATVSATGTNKIKFTDGAGALTSLTVAGAGSLNVTSVMTALKTLTVADGGITLDATGGVLKTVNTGAGKDTITTAGAIASQVVNTGAGNDSVTVTTAVDATGSFNLGDGNDTLTLSAAPAAGATLGGGNGTDTLAVTVANYNTISGFTAANLAKITGFEVLSITGAPLANASSIDLGSLAGLTSVKTLGVATGGTATVTNIGANASVTVSGATATNDGILVATLKDATGTADVLNYTINTDVTDNGNGAANSFAGTGKLTAAGVETLNVTSTFTLTNAGAADDLDYATNALTIVDNAVTSIKIDGAAVTTYTVDTGATKLANIDASANTGGVTIDASPLVATGVAMTIKGSATAANTLTGAGLADTIVGGAKADTITGGAGGDTLTGGAGNDSFVYAAGNSSIGTGTFDTITDFAANTYGNGSNGAAGTGANGTASKWTGDILAFTHTGTAVAANGFKVFVANNAADATTFLANTASAANTQASAALDSSSNNLYVDVSGDGVADFYIHLTGVATITAAAFTLA